MSAEENVAILRGAYAKWSESKGKSFGAWLDIMADDAQLRSLAEGRGGVDFSAPRFSRAGVESYLRELDEAWAMVSHHMNEFIAQDDRVVVLGQVAWRHKITGQVAETPKVDVWRFSDGKAIDFFELYDTARMAACVNC